MFFLLILITLPFLAIAESSSSIQLDLIKVIPSGHMMPVEDVQASVEVLNRERLDRYGDSNVSQALKQAVGVASSNSGSSGSLSIRGFNTNHTLLLIDGFRRTNNYGGSNPSQIGYFDIERIEVIRGPLSSLYGSEALGGVVNVITRHPGVSPGVSLSINSGGSEQGRETLQTGINVRAGDEALGHSITLEQTYRNDLQHKHSLGDDAGELNNWSGSYRGRWQPSHTQSIGWALEFFDRDSKADSIKDKQNYIQYEEERRYFSSIDYNKLATYGELEVRGSVGQSIGETNRSYPVVETTDFMQYQADAIYHIYPVTSHKVSAGSGIKRDVLDVSINQQIASRNNVFFVAQDQWDIDAALSFVAGLRYDHYDDFGSSVNPRISLAWEALKWSARVGYGEGFRAPSLLEQFSSFNRGRILIQGNANLKAENSSSWEAMLRRNLGEGYVELTLHHNDIIDLIDSVTTDKKVGALSVVEYQNIGKARIRGAELAIEIPVTDYWLIRSSVEALDAIDTNTNERLTGRSRTVTRLNVEYSPNQWSIYSRMHHMNNFWGVDASAPRGAKPHNTNLLIIDVGLNYRVSRNLQLSLGVDNLFDNQDPDNTARSQTNDPDARYFHVSTRLEF